MPTKGEQEGLGGSAAAQVGQDDPNADKQITQSSWGSWNRPLGLASTLELESVEGRCNGGGGGSTISTMPGLGWSNLSDTGDMGGSSAAVWLAS